MNEYKGRVLADFLSGTRSDLVLVGGTMDRALEGQMPTWRTALL